MKENQEALNSLTDEVQKAKVTSRVRGMNRRLKDYKQYVQKFFTDVEVANQGPSQIETHDHAPTETYTTVFSVPRNPPRLTLDYNTKCTYEGMLKDAILDGSTSGIVAVLASGLGGVGKTCALRGLAMDSEIKTRFPEGILYMQLGNDSRPSDIVNGIADAVMETGGRRLAPKVRNALSFADALTIARRWFTPYKCLFLIDDIWYANGITSGSLRKLRTMLHDESLLVYTTRDERFQRGAERVIRFKPR